MIHPYYEYISALLILLYIPFICISDWKTRTFNFLYFIPLIIVNIPLLYIYLSGSPMRNYLLMGLTLILCLVVFVMAVAGVIGGGDFWFITIILLTVPYNPFITIRKYFPLDFFYTLMIVACYIPIIIYLYHVRRKDKLPLKEMLTSFPGHFPYMIPISFAFVATLAIEMVMYP